MNHWEIIEGHLGTPQGFRGATVEAGIKKRKGTPDLALIFSEAERTTAAAVFTTNRAAAAPVEVSRRNLRSSRGRARAVVVNSGNANCATGREGLRTARETARTAGRLLRVPTEQVMVASTGVIGVPLKPDLITRQLPALRAKLARARAAGVARAIMTTDTFPKSRVLRSTLAGKTVHLAGIAKGAGMIHPRMATMLSFITTDAALTPRDLNRFLRAAVDVSFHRLSVDGDTSTNDTVLALASGVSGASARWGTRAGRQFQEGLSELCQALAKMIASDGEGARKLVTLEVCGARSASDAERIARAVANSPLVKTALAGSDPNWGRVLCAAGYSGAALDPEKVDIRVNDMALCRRGRDTGFDEAAARRELDRAELTLRLDLHLGKASTRFWTCDLTHDYITINASYRT